MYARYSLITLGFFVAVSATGYAQTTASNIEIPVIDRPPELGDFAGMTPSAEIRGKMAMITDFVQRVPDDGEPATQRTEGYLAYDDRNIYAVFLAFDEQPDLVRANLSPRENVSDDDTVSILIDTFNDQRTGYAFRSTPLGVQWDGRWNEAGRSQGFDSSYQAVWYTDAELTESGFAVLMTVPFRTLRFPETGEQTWRIMLERQRPRLSEQSHWPAYSNTISGRLNQAASLTG
ncbi:MAG TPA: carbohydrate binding family 9 domain-containing protein, partial [Gammaproteobacteria bacterium]